MKEKTLYSQRRQNVATRLLAGCKRIGCVYADRDGCGAGLGSSQVFNALALGEGCNLAAIREQGEKTPVSFDGITVRYRE